MSTRPDHPATPPTGDPENYVLAEVVPTDEDEVQPGKPPWLAIGLFLACCISTYSVPGGGLLYAVCVMGILLCHEMGHYIQARRYRVPASFPYFIPFPISPIGTMGAVIAMRGHIGDRKALYDIGISGPLAGLVPTLICCWLGITWSEVVVRPDNMGEPLLFQWMVRWYFGPLAPGETVYIHPVAFAGWVGLFLTGLNLFPIGQLDGGHVLYALLREKAHVIAWIVVIGSLVAMVISGAYFWLLMLTLIILIGPAHPPTANDEAPLGIGRIILGWLTLAFVVISFTPTPFVF